MPIMQKGPSSCPNKRMSLEERARTTISLEESSFILKRFLRHPSEGFPPNTKDTRRCSAKRSHRDCLDTPSGTMLSNYSREPPHHYPGGSSPLPRVKSLKCKSS